LAETCIGAVDAQARMHPDSPVAPHVTVSVGVACAVARPGEAVESLVERADAALYAAKRGGRHRAVLAPD
jgi:diguanylate cyclase (GGDEF)-like protein